MNEVMYSGSLNEETVVYQKTYQEYKAELDGELRKTAEGFVRIGYLLKVARDTNVLAESGYKTVSEFAESEYNLSRTQVSRFISINDKFSEGGYSENLLPEYRGFGYAKLTIMLQLPDTINEELKPEYTKAEIQAIKEEVEEEKKITDIEVLMEAPVEVNEMSMSMLDKAIHQLGEDDPALYVSISEKMDEYLVEVLPSLMAPAGDKMYSIRIPGTGRVMLAISDVSDTVRIINTRTGEKESYTWTDVAAAWTAEGVFGSATVSQSPQECWEQRYERRFPGAEEPKIAPVQQKTEPVSAKKVKKPEQKKESKVKKAPKKPEPKKAEPKKPEPVKSEPKQEEPQVAAVEPEIVEVVQVEIVDDKDIKELFQQHALIRDHIEKRSWGMAKAHTRRLLDMLEAQREKDIEERERYADQEATSGKDTAPDEEPAESEDTAAEDEACGEAEETQSNED